MQQLLQIENVPIKLEIKSTMAKFQKPEVPAVDLNSLNHEKTVSSGNRGEKAKAASAKPAYPEIDEYVNTRESGSYSDMLSSELSVNSVRGTDVSVSKDFIRAGIQNTAIQRDEAEAVSHSEFIDKQMEIYASDRSSFELSAKLGITDMEFVPGSVEFNVIQKPAVNIEYIGTPIYVPRSADPNYVDVYA